MIWLIAIDIDIKLFLLYYMSCMFNFSEDCLSTYKVNDMFNRLFVNINARNPACLSLLLKHIYKNYTLYIRSAYIYTSKYTT